MKRALSTVLLFAFACLLSGLYGVIHNQISYTVSNEYFTKFKFNQFHILPGTPHRMGASIVGWEASWWMGLVIGTFVIPCGLLLRDNRSFVFAVLRSFFVILMTTFVVGIAALLVAFLVTQPTPGALWTFRDVPIADPVAFRIAGTMHNFSYLGGLLGIFTGITSILRSFLAENAKLKQNGS